MDYHQVHSGLVLVGREDLLSERHLGWIWSLYADLHSFVLVLMELVMEFMTENYIDVDTSASFICNNESLENTPVCF